jgi:hypothetical protein
MPEETSHGLRATVIRLLGAGSMDGNTRWAVTLIVAVALAGIVLIVSAGSASAATISGTVTDNSKTPVPGAIVTLYQKNQEYGTTNNPATTGITGYYEFTGLPSGDYSISVEKNADGIFSTSASTRIENGDVTLDLRLLGYTYKPGMPTLSPYTVTASPVPAPTATPKPTPKPTPKTSNTPVPLPTIPEEPGFEVLLAVISLGLLAVIKSSGKR